MADDSMHSKANHFVVSWQEFHKECRILSHKLLKHGTWKGIVAITRGGLVPAAIVARELEIRFVDTLCLASYDHDQQGAIKILKAIEGDGEGFVIIDDLVDTGKTAEIARQMLPKAHFAAVYAKPQGRPFADTYVTEINQDTWIFFPWDVDMQYAQPIVDARHSPA